MENKVSQVTDQKFLNEDPDDLFYENRVDAIARLLNLADEAINKLPTQIIGLINFQIAACLDCAEPTPFVGRRAERMSVELKTKRRKRPVHISNGNAIKA